LIDELHKSARISCWSATKKAHVIGSLAFQELGLESRGKVRDVMDTTVTTCTKTTVWPKLCTLFRYQPPAVYSR